MNIENEREVKDMMVEVIGSIVCGAVLTVGAIGLAIYGEIVERSYRKKKRDKDA